ncbi:MAG: DUF5615 family PIN-like protein [Chloroflexota bacterium]
MRFLIDESADVRLGRHLQRHGHDVTRIAVDHPASLPDSEVLSIAVRESRILITFDRDFGELVFNESQPHAGVLYFRLGRIDLDTEIERMEFVLQNYAESLDRFLTITRTSVRVRR